MNSTEYLTSYGWTPGTGFKKDSLARPILVHHKKDTKGLGNKSLEHESWWERVFDGRLQELDVYSKKKEEEIAVASVRGARESPLYRMFVKGEGLEGSITSSIVIESSKTTTTTKTAREKKSKTAREKKSKKEKNTKKIEKPKKKAIEKKEKKEKSKDDEWVRSMIKEMKQNKSD
ncbi:uncharacterized protein V2V93DRAFT_356584 [Kockiozyma suomiensis]|uniref:uncharacterized protein n=1 Tax=Kockiozyma suomiensis TaxID=1337062 RepID=UPI0033434545